MNDALPLAPAAPNRPVTAPELSVIVPTFNERDNVLVLFARLDAALQGVAWEAIFVDDNSPDGTWEVVKDLARRDPRARALRRIGRRGLAGACIEGCLASSAAYVAVIDADLQHDETRLPAMLAKLRAGEADIAIGSRYVEGGSSASFDKRRQGISSFATTLAQKLLRIDVADPMSGFFMLRRDRFEQVAPQLSVQGFKILLDILASARGALRVAEVPFVFGTRHAGESKLDSMVAVDFLGLVLAKLTRDAVSLRFLLFASVGALGFVVHLALLYLVLSVSDMPFAEAQTIAAVGAMTSNFLLNNFLTYRDQRLKGAALLRGLLLFYLVCSVGLVANVGVAFSAYGHNASWWLAGAAGALMGVVWNYAMSGLFVWRKR